MRAKDAPNLSQVSGVLPGGCVVLVAEAQQPPHALLTALTSRGLAPQVLHDEPAVMAALAEQAQGRRVLVVVEPDRWQRLGELTDAVRVYHTDVLCWQYTDAGEPGAQGISCHLSTLSLTTGTLHSDEAGTSPIGQIVGRHRRVDELLVKLPSATPAAREIVTREELSMLLGPAPGEAS